MDGTSTTTSGSGRAPAMPREVEKLRALLDARLTALEAALADPKQHGSLEKIILDLARIATEEADATARLAYLDAQREAQNALAAVREQERAAREAEQTTAASVRQALEQAQVALQQAQATLQQERAAGAARDREAVTIRQALEQAQGALQQERAAGAARDRDIASTRQALEQAQGALQQERAAAAARDRDIASTRQALEQAQAALQQERTSGSARERDLVSLGHTLEQQQTAVLSLRRDLEQAQSALQAEKAAAAELRAENEASASRDREIAVMRKVLEKAQTELQSARAAVTARDRDVSSSQQTHEQALGREQAAQVKLRHELDGARKTLEGERAVTAKLHETAAKQEAELGVMRRDIEARAKTLSRTQADVEQALREAEARYEALRDASAKQIRQLEKAARDAETRADEAARERQASAQSSEAASDAIAAAQAELQMRYDNIRETSEKRIRALELAVRDAEERAEALQRDLDKKRREEKIHTPAAAAATPIAQSPTAAAPAAEPPAGGPVRVAQRYMMAEQVDIQIDGTPSKLIDLSTTGAQVLCPAAMKPNRMVKLTLPLGDKTVSCKGKVMWARLEPSKGGQLWYRAGMSFTTIDEKGVEAFLKRHSKP